MIGVTAMNLGDRELAREALGRSLRMHPTRRTLRRYARALVPARSRRAVAVTAVNFIFLCGYAE